MPRTNATRENPTASMTQRARRLSMPLPDYPMRWMRREDAIKEGYLPFAGFFLPHEYGMISGFILDLERAGREYCGVRDLKCAKGTEIFAKNGNTNRIISESPENTRTTEGAKSMVSQSNWTKAEKGESEAPEGESRIRASQEAMAGGEE